MALSLLSRYPHFFFFFNHNYLYAIIQIKLHFLQVQLGKLGSARTFFKTTSNLLVALFRRLAQLLVHFHFPDDTCCVEYKIYQWLAAATVATCTIMSSSILPAIANYANLTRSCSFCSSPICFRCCRCCRFTTTKATSSSRH